MELLSLKKKEYPMKKKPYTSYYESQNEDVSIFFSKLCISICMKRLFLFTQNVTVIFPDYS